MTFKDKYKDLEDKFKAQIYEDNETFLKDSAEKSYYLPNIKPEGPVDFVLVAMEPSGFAETSDPSLRSEQPICPRNFSCSDEDFILHFCVQNYLCQGWQSYHVTDLAKGGLPTKLASKTARERWKGWYPLLCEELESVRKNDTPVPVIAIGKKVENFLKEQKTPNLAGSILHFSKSATKYRKKIPDSQPVRYSQFATALRWDDVVQNASDVIKGEEFDTWRCGTLQRLKRGETESRKMLMFTYKVQFADILGKPLT